MDLMHLIQGMATLAVVGASVEYTGEYFNASELTRWLVGILICGFYFLHVNVPVFVYAVPLALIACWLIKKGSVNIVKTLAKIVGVLAVAYGVFLLIKNREKNIVGKTQRMLEKTLGLACGGN